MRLALILAVGFVAVVSVAGLLFGVSGARGDAVVRRVSKVEWDRLVGGDWLGLFFTGEHSRDVMRLGECVVLNSARTACSYREDRI